MTAGTLVLLSCLEHLSKAPPPLKLQVKKYVFQYLRLYNDKKKQLYVFSVQNEYISHLSSPYPVLYTP